MKMNSSLLGFHLQRKVKNYNLREFISAKRARSIGQEEIEGESNLAITDEALHTNELKTKGYTEFEKPIPPGLIQDIIDHASELPLYDPYNRGIGDFAFKDIPEATNIASYKRNDVVVNQTVLRIANDPAILRIVKGFLGATPTISNVNMWWSVAGKSEAKNPQLFHRDVDDFKFCKLFIYLTNVGLNDGPHIYVKNSSATNKLTKIRRYSDQEVEDAFGKENVVTFCKPKGSFFIVDTYGLHKGKLPVDNNRLLIQLQYSLNPVGVEVYTPVPFENNYNRYINRLIVS